MRMAALPRRSSARESLSVHRRSDVVIGRLMVAAAQSLTPPGWIETCPLMYFSRATRDGGSASANNAAVEDAASSATKAAKTNCRRFFISPAPLQDPSSTDLGRGLLACTSENPETHSLFWEFWVPGWVTSVIRQGRILRPRRARPAKASWGR